MPGTIWERFEHDPRRPENAGLRASDRDRDAVQELLGTPFPWPAFVTIGTGWHWFQLVTSHQDTVASIERSMEKRERRRLEQQARRERKQLGP